MDGTEKVINSGIILPPMESTGAAVDQNSSAAATDGEETTPGTGVMNETATSAGNTTAQGTEGGAEQPPIGPPFPPVSSFTVTFEQPGTYPYFCAIHPWMVGQVVVREAGANQTATAGGGAGNQTSIEGGNETSTQEENRTGALASLFE